MYKRNYSNFSEDSFRDDVSIQNFDNNFEDVNDQFKDFYLRLKGCIDRHAPLKKLTPKEVKFNHKFLRIFTSLLLQMILSLGILSLSKEIVILSLTNLAMQKPRLTSFF